MIKELGVNKMVSFKEVRYKLKEKPTLVNLRYDGNIFIPRFMSSGKVTTAILENYGNVVFVIDGFETLILSIDDLSFFSIDGKIINLGD